MLYCWHCRGLGSIQAFFSLHKIYGRTLSCLAVFVESEECWGWKRAEEPSSRLKSRFFLTVWPALRSEQIAQGFVVLGLNVHSPSRPQCQCLIVFRLNIFFSLCQIWVPLFSLQHFSRSPGVHLIDMACLGLVSSFFRNYSVPLVHETVHFSFMNFMGFLVGLSLWLAEGHPWASSTAPFKLKKGALIPSQRPLIKIVNRTSPWIESLRTLCVICLLVESKPSAVTPSADDPARFLLGW